MTILVTGGAGFIGSNFIFFLRQKYPDRPVVCLDKLTYAGNAATLAPLAQDPLFRFVRGDICDVGCVEDLFKRERPDVVVNFAAESHVDRSFADPDVFLQTHVVGVSVLLDACRKFGTERFHQISTDEVYGAAIGDGDFTESSPLAPSSPYSASKAAADLLALACAKSYGLPVTISRSCNNFGPYQFPEKLIPLTIVRILRGEPVPVYGDGENRRDWLAVEDHCAAVDAILTRGRPGEIYNVAAHQEISNIAVVQEILRLLGRPEAAIEFVADRPGHDRRYGVDTTKIASETGFRPSVPWREGLARTVRWYVQNEDWWAPLLK